MKLVVGLGNPGEKYQNTRHNVGFMALDAMKAQNSKLKTQNDNSKFKMNKKMGAETAFVESVILVKPQTFMNKSGEAVKRVMEYYDVDIDNVWVIHDDLDIQLGEYKIQLGKGPKMHNGMESVERSLGTKEFWRVRVGVDSRNQQQDDTSKRIPGDRYVLSDFSQAEKVKVDQVLDSVSEELLGRLK